MNVTIITEVASTAVRILVGAISVAADLAMSCPMIDSLAEVSVLLFQYKARFLDIKFVRIL